MANRRNLAIAAAVTVAMLIGTTLISITASTADNAFARKYQRHDASDVNQAASVSNTCLNPASNSNTNDNMISNGNCGGTVSQQGRSGQASTPTTVQNANPTIEVQRQSTTSAQPLLGAGNCIACFANLTASQKSAFESQLTNIFAGTGITTIEQLCTALRNTVIDNGGELPEEALRLIQNTLSNIDGVGPAAAINIRVCLESAIQ